jgi:anti-anti-sigma factor
LSSILDNLPIGVWVLDAKSLTPGLANQIGRGLIKNLANPPENPTPEPKTDGAESEEQAQFCHADTDQPLAFSDLPFQLCADSGEPQRMEFDVLFAGQRRQSFDCVVAPLRKADGSHDSILAVFSDITAHKQVLQERLHIQGELIRTQAAALAERSTPLIPLSDRIMVMPIIGSIDSQRSAQIMDSLLLGINRTNARIAVLDITGVPMIDSSAALGILTAARAVNLVGAEVLLTGIRAEVAQTLVKLGIDLKGIVTFSTLQAGIAYAQKRWGTA